MIPKIIHYFSNDVNIWQKDRKAQVRMCVNSWLKHCPDYKLMLWHDKTPEFQEILKRSPFVKRAYELKMWAFVADYIRCYALYKHGGIYLDTDVELVDNFDKFLKNDFFISTEGNILFGESVPEPAVMGGIAGHKIFEECIKIYESKGIFSMDNFVANLIMKKVLKEQYGFTRLPFQSKAPKSKVSKYFDSTIPNKLLDDYELYVSGGIWQDESKKITVYPCEYFCPTWEAFQNKAFTDKTVAIHWYQSSWRDEKKLNMLKNNKYSVQHLMFVDNITSKLQNIFSVKNAQDGNKIMTILGMPIKMKRHA